MRVMKKRRRMWWITAALLVTLAAVWWFWPVRSSQPAVRLVLLGYTNQSVPLHPGKEVEQTNKLFMPVALVMATNTGRCTVELWPTIAPRFFLTNANGVTMAYNMCRVEKFSQPQYLRPGGSVSFEVWPWHGKDQWQLEMAYHTYSTQKDLFRRVMKASGPAIGQWLEKVYRSPEIHYAELGPFTNVLSFYPKQ